MKNVMINLGNNFKTYSVYFGIFFMALGLTSCSDDDDGVITPPEVPMGSISASDQTVTGDSLMVDNVQAETDAWLVVRRSDETGESLADPVFIAENTNTSIIVNLFGTWSDGVTEGGETVMLLLYRDDGDGTYESGEDNVLLTNELGNATETIVITPPADPASSEPLTVSNQTLTQNTLILDNVNVEQDSWIIVNNAGQQNMVADPFFVQAGSHQNVRIPLTDQANLMGDADGDDFDISIFEDNPDQGVQGEFDADVDTTPVTDDTGAEVGATVNVTSPTFTITDQDVVDNTVTFDEVTGASDSWITIYNENQEGTIDETDIVGRAFVGAGTTDPVTVTFDDDFTYTPGQNIFPRLHVDDPADQEFTFETDNTTDVAELYGFDAAGQPMFVGGSTGVVIQ